LKSFVKRWLGDPEASGEARASAGGPSIAPGRRLYAIGDIHGRLDLLRELHALIAGDAATFDGERTLVYLGDYIDRGPASREVIDELLDAPLPGFAAVHLLGNHEQTLLDFLQYPQQAAGWLAWGGRETLQSYGVRPPPDFMRADIELLRDQFQARLPDRHVAFFRGMPLTHVAGDYLFVHAGIRPGVPLQEQDDSDLLWIRRDFTASEEVHEHVVVHGHSINEEVEMRPNRIGIDTGAFYTGVLTCLVLEGAERRLLQTGCGR
jgi:serine/threonine protein phosphatase 1